MTYQIERNGKTFTISGKFGAFSVYLGKQCLAFDIMTKDDAENFIWAHY